MAIDPNAPPEPQADPNQPAPPPTPSDPTVEMRATLNTLNTENETLKAGRQADRSILGRVAKELGIEVGADPEAFSKALVTLRDLKKAPPAGDPNEGKSIPEEEHRTALTTLRTQLEEEHSATVKEAKAAERASLNRWQSDRVETVFALACAEHDPPLRVSAVLDRIQSRRRHYDYEVTASENGRGILIHKRGDETRAPFYDEKRTKHLTLDDVLADVAKDDPGVVLVEPTAGTGAGVGAMRGPAPRVRKEVGDMTPGEKIRTMFKD